MRFESRRKRHSNGSRLEWRLRLSKAGGRNDGKRDCARLFLPPRLNLLNRFRNTVLCVGIQMSHFQTSLFTSEEVYSMSIQIIYCNPLVYYLTIFNRQPHKKSVDGGPTTGLFLGRGKAFTGSMTRFSSGLKISGKPK